MSHESSPDVPPPFCTRGADSLPVGPLPGTAESVALAAWEVLTGARVSRSTGSGRMSLLGKYRSAEADLTTDRVLWISLHPFEGADERWECRRALRGAMSDRELQSAIVQEMGGPADDPDEMTTLGFWCGPVGFYFDCRGPRVEITEQKDPDGCPRETATRRIGRSALLRAARRLLSIEAGTDRGRRPAPSASLGLAPSPETDPGEQLTLL